VPGVAGGGRSRGALVRRPSSSARRSHAGRAGAYRRRARPRRARASPRRPTAGEQGFSIADLLVVLAVVAIVAGLGLPDLFRATEQTRLGLGAGEIASSLRLTRVYAVRHSANVAIKFHTGDDGGVSYALFRDGDGDGVRTADIEHGVDPQVEPWRRLTQLGRGVGFGFPPGPLPRDPTSGRPIGGSRDDPIRFNSSDLASFSAGGTATPGSVYLTDGRRGLIVVRVTNLSGRVRTLRWDRHRAAWRQL
jgi:type II secretory pathway pseudopilin PulG